MKNQENGVKEENEKDEDKDLRQKINKVLEYEKGRWFEKQEFFIEKRKIKKRRQYINYYY